MRIVQVGHAVELEVVRPAGTLHEGVREVVGQCTVQDFDCGGGLRVGRWRGWFRSISAIRAPKM